MTFDQYMAFAERCTYHEVVGGMNGGLGVASYYNDRIEAYSETDAIWVAASGLAERTLGVDQGRFFL